MPEASFEQRLESQMKICVVGSGYVGLVAGACFADVGNTVVCADIDARKIEMLKRNELPIYEPGLDEIVSEARGKNLFFSTEVRQAIHESEMIFVSVNTPTKTYGVGADRGLDLGQNDGVADISCHDGLLLKI